MKSILFCIIIFINQFELLSFHLLYILANIAPEMLCHTEKIAPGTVAIANEANDVNARLVARPEFCIPISIEIAFVFAVLYFNIFPNPNPQTYPKTLCKMTTVNTIKPVDKIFDAL